MERTAARAYARRMSRISPAHALLALAIVAVWGTNFVVIRVVLDELPPLLVATLRFMLALVLCSSCRGRACRWPTWRATAC